MRTPEELTELFRSTGRKVTAQRQCIFRLLQGDVTHPSAEAVHAEASREMETISLKTVYQTLHDLAELGEIASLDVGTGMTRFDPNVDDPTTTWCAAGAAGCATWSPTSPTCRFPKGADLGFDVGSAEIVFRGSVPRVPAGGRNRRRAPPAGLRCHRPTEQPVVLATTPMTSNTHERNTMPSLKDRKTEANLKVAFAGESQANRRYLYFAQKADVEGYPDVAALFRSVAEGETGHAFGHFDFLREVGDPVTGVPVGPTEDNLKSAIEGETYEYSEMYPGFARTARDEGFVEIAEWLETLARAEKSHAGRFTEGLASVA